MSLNNTHRGILIAVATLGWLLHPVGGTAPFQLEESDLDLNETALRVDQESFERWLPWVDPHGQLRDAISTTAQALNVSLASGLKLRAAWLSRPPATSPDSSHTLRGLRVLLDPGHHGGEWSEHESRHVERDGHFPIREGNLTYKTAELAANLLTHAGATVFLTRGPPPQTPFERDVPTRDLLEKEASIWLGNNAHRADTRFLMRAYPMWFADFILRKRRDAKIEDSAAHLFSIGDLRRRSSLATECDAQAMVSIHYNGAKKPEVNHVMAFVPGHFMKGELMAPASQKLALDALMRGRLPISAELGQSLVKALMSEMRLKTIDQAKHGRSYPLPGYRGVFARNLAVLRRTRVPVVLVEGPFMSHPAEYPKLLNAEDGSPGIRTHQYARAILSALKENAPGLRAYREATGTAGTESPCPLEEWSALSQKDASETDTSRGTR